MLTETQLLRAQELFTAAVSYNTCLHNAFVSQEDLVETDLYYNGSVERVSIPTYHYLLRTIDKLAKTVSQLQISDDGSDVVQLLTTANNLTLLYLQKRQFYVQPPSNAKLLAYDYESIPTVYSSVDRTVLRIDMTDCKLPMDAQYVIATFDNDAFMRLPLLFKSTSIDKIANVLSITEGSAKSYLLDSNDLTVGMQVQCNSTVYKVTSVSGQSIQLEAMQLGIVKPIKQGDVLYTVTDTTSAYVEVPVTKMHTSLSLQVQYMQLLSAKAIYDVSSMSTAIHQTLQIALKDVLRGESMQDILNIASVAIQPISTDIDSIIQNSVPKVTKTTVKQTNAHQYVHSVIETMIKTNAVLVQTKADIKQIEELISTVSANIIATGGNLSNDTALLSYNDQLASLKTRYQSAQASLAAMNVSAQSVRPEYAATIYCESNDSAGLPIIQYIARYQYLSFEVKDVANNWLYAYGDKRTVHKDGDIFHDIDDYDMLNSIQLPIHAYEQLVVQVSAVLQYGQPLMNVQTPWTNSLFITIPEALLKEVSIDEMFKNAYEAKLYTNVQQALEAAGVFRHINTNAAYAHRAQDIQYDNDNTVYAKMQQMLREISTLQQTAATKNLNVYILYKEQLYPVTQSSQIVLTADAYCKQAFGNASGANLSALLGTVIEETFDILIVNNATETVYLHSMIPGNTDSALLIDTWPNYANIPIVKQTTVKIDTVEHNTTIQIKPTEGMALYRGKQNAIGNRILTIDSNENWNASGIAINNPAAVNLQMQRYAEQLNGTLKPVSLSTFKQQSAMISYGRNATANSEYGIFGNMLYDYPGIGIHIGFPLFYGNIDNDGNVMSPSYAYNKVMDYTTVDFANPFDAIPVAYAAKRLAMEAPLITGLDETVSLNATGNSLLTDNFRQAALFLSGTEAYADGSNKSYNAMTKFEPNVHKFTSGRASRGSFLFIDTVESGNYSLSSLKLPIYGSSNAMQINPGDTESPGLRIRCKFQSRMCDRLGLTDNYAVVSTDSNGNLLPARAGSNFMYAKTISLSVKVGLQVISFDVTMQMPWLS